VSIRTAYVVSGHITNEGAIQLDDHLPLPPGPVRVSVESLASPSPSFAWPSAEDLTRRKAVMDACVGCLSDEEAHEILHVVEREFEAVPAPS